MCLDMSSETFCLQKRNKIKQSKTNNKETNLTKQKCNKTNKTKPKKKKETKKQTKAQGKTKEKPKQNQKTTIISELCLI